jgi:hypothetical protein
MSTASQDAMIWMNKTFGTEIEAALAGTAITKQILIAIGMQETYYIWRKLYLTGTASEVLSVCVGDTLDFPRRKTAWPKNRAELEAHPNGDKMFRSARAALERLAKNNSGYATAAKNPNKFCHGFGMFQYDIQFFKTDPDFFLNENWATWTGTLSRGVTELKDKLEQLYGPGKTKLSHDEMVYLAIAYNQGAAKTKKNMATKGFKQGHADDNGVFYGEHIGAYLKAMRGLF